MFLQGFWWLTMVVGGRGWLRERERERERERTLQNNCLNWFINSTYSWVFWHLLKRIPERWQAHLVAPQCTSGNYEEQIWSHETLTPEMVGTCVFSGVKTPEAVWFREVFWASSRFSSPFSCRLIHTSFQADFQKIMGIVDSIAAFCRSWGNLLWLFFGHTGNTSPSPENDLLQGRTRDGISKNKCLFLWGHKTTCCFASWKVGPFFQDLSQRKHLPQNDQWLFHCCSKDFS